MSESQVFHKIRDILTQYINYYVFVQTKQQS